MLEGRVPLPEMRLTVRRIYDIGKEVSEHDKKLFCFAAPVLLLLVAGTLLLCKHHAERTGLACLDSDL